MSNEPNQCQCKVCVRNREIAEVLKNGSEEARLEVFRHIHDCLEEAETNVAYYKSILDGSWPNARTILKTALKRIEDKNEHRTNLPNPAEPIDPTF